MSSVRVKVRGIYTTALTHILLQGGLTLVQPSPAIVERFGLAPAQGEEEINIYDRPDKQGILIEGDEEKVRAVLALLRSALPHAIARAPHEAPPPSQTKGTWLSWAEFVKLRREPVDLEFPLTCKLALDALRAQCISTLPHHHLLKVMDAAAVDEAERGLAAHPDQAQDLALGLKRELIYPHFGRGRAVVVEHVKPEGNLITLRGRVSDFRPGEALTLERTFQAGGDYDGLGLPREEGDRGLVEIVEGSWVSRRSYLSAQGILKGELYNINTPAELYQGTVRYLDLEVDVVRWPDGSVGVIDRERLERAVARGFITREAASKALAEATGLEARLKRP